MANDLTTNTVTDGKTVTDGYMTSLAALNAEYRATLDALDADYKAKRRALHNARHEERAALMADYWERLAPKPHAPKPHAQPEGTYWHFLEASRVLRFGDGRQVVPGVTLNVPGPPVFLVRGMHASRLAIDVLNLAPGPVACLVTLGGLIVHEASQSVAESRTVLWMYDAGHLLREFACDLAESALLSERKDGREPSTCSWVAIAVMRRFLRGEATEAEREAAWLAADNVSYDVTGAAARYAAIAAAAAAGSAPACAVARDVTRAAAGAAASAAALAAKNAVRDGAWFTAWDAANAAVRYGFNERLTQMLLCARAEGLGEFAAANCGAEKDEA